MKQIRLGVFETNSSSTHSICIRKEKASIPFGKTVHFTTGEYGWENDTVWDTASYLYTAIMYNENSKENLARLKSLLDEMGIKYKFAGPRKDYFEYGYIDHGYELGAFIESVLSDKDLLARYLFGDSFIKTGNDNEDCDPSGCNIAEETIWDYSAHAEVPNPYHDTEHYDYFLKGN